MNQILAATDNTGTCTHPWCRAHIEGTDTCTRPLPPVAGVAAFLMARNPGDEPTVHLVPATGDHDMVRLTRAQLAEIAANVDTALAGGTR